MSELKKIKEILHSQQLAPSRERGQNFLANPQVAARIVAEAGLTKDDTVIELGVGLASLTLPLASQAGRVIGLEVDRGIVEWHARSKCLPDNVTLVHEDLLQADYKKLAGKYGKLKILANLPYSVSSPLLFKLLENASCISFAVLMLQKEMAQRLSAAKDTKEYGILTVLFAPYTEVRQLFSVGPGNFHPRPKVDSSVVRLDFHAPPAALQIEEIAKAFRLLVRTAFQQRRKTLLNSLGASPLFAGGKEQLRRILQTLAIDPRTRPENLDFLQFLAMAEELRGPAASP